MQQKDAMQMCALMIRSEHGRHRPRDRNADTYVAPFDDVASSGTDVVPPVASSNALCPIRPCHPSVHLGRHCWRFFLHEIAPGQEQSAPPQTLRPASGSEQWAEAPSWGSMSYSGGIAKEITLHVVHAPQRGESF
jgi:hypothetical protein